MEEFLIYCPTCHEYSRLGKYDKKGHCFQGEYSLLHNCHLESGQLIFNFLKDHSDHSVKLVRSKTNEYMDILKNAHHYKSKDIDQLADEMINKQKAVEDERLLDRELGQLQLHILKGLLEEEANTISNQATQTSAESQFLLGKEEGLKKALNILTKLIEKTSILYRKNVRGEIHLIPKNKQN
ncbi:hypothetical protein SAMN04488137_1627 [Fictibacillus solisalsi]|uniref:Uncharacterized protein n=1 Tax=Fictibacillus solisalsi TaxID=459525 RepID=A0A1G9VJ77_9BACL|nr:hypothetical protein [Fictibacillus solisalsi]SDM72338.1 hypothetical protein SAMN04488137_1627 [Fictibacillus solisalsi]